MNTQGSLITRIYKVGIAITIGAAILGLSIMNSPVVHAQEATTPTPQPLSSTPEPQVGIAGDDCATHSIFITLHSEQIRFCAPTDLPANVVQDHTSDPDLDYAQFNQIGGYGIINIKAIAAGYKTGNGRPVYDSGAVARYRQEMWQIESSKTDRVVSAGPNGLFWNEENPSLQIEAQLSTSLGKLTVRSVEWYVEHNGRLWSIVILWDTNLENAEEWASSASSFALYETTASHIPDTAIDLSIAPESPPLQGDVQPGIPVDLGTPSWWSGTCNDTNYFPYTGAHSFLLGSSWHGVPSCGPRPMTVTTPDHPVAFFAGAHQELEFECVELVMRFLYQEWGIEPWAGNGNEIMNGYPTDTMTFYPNGTHSLIPGDILTEDGSLSNPSGHTAIITAVNLDTTGTGAINILEQNMSNNGSRSLHVTNWSVDPDAEAGGQIIQGWLRVLSNKVDSNYLYAASPSNLWQIHPSTGVDGVTIPSGYQYTDLAFNGRTLYGVTFSQLFSINPRTGARVFIGNTGYSNVNALTSGLDGTLYAATTTGAFLRINKANGTGTFVGYYGPGYISSGDLAMRYDGTMYASVMRSGFTNNWLAKININTGQATPIGDLGESGVFGLDFKDGNLYGVTTGGYLLSIDTNTGSSARIKQIALNGNFWGLTTLGPLEVSVGGGLKHTYDAPFQKSTRASYPGLNSGPVKITNTDDVPIIASERVIYKVNGVNTSYAEMMGLPNRLLDTTYWLPWYNNVDLDTQLRFANVSTSNASVHVLINGQEMNGSPFTLPPGASTRRSFPGINSGPVQIVSNVPIVAAERVIYKVFGINTSFTELMAMPNSQLDTTYWLPWYNNKDLDTQLRFANVSNVDATVHVLIGGQEMPGSPFSLAPGASTRQSFSGINNGPVQIVSNVPIVAAERVIYKVLGLNTSYSEAMALPDSQLDTTYWLPWYNNVDLDTQLRFANVSNSDATVHVLIGGVEMNGSPFTLAPGASTRQSFTGVNNGPVLIVSDAPVVAAGRVIYKVLGVNASYSELMALPNGLLDTTYWLPWYNNVDLDTQLRFGVP